MAEFGKVAIRQTAFTDRLLIVLMSQLFAIAPLTPVFLQQALLSLYLILYALMQLLQANQGIRTAVGSNTCVGASVLCACSRRSRVT